MLNMLCNTKGTIILILDHENIGKCHHFAMLAHLVLKLCMFLCAQLIAGTNYHNCVILRTLQHSDFGRLLKC